MLIAIVAVTGFVQQRQIQGRNPNAQVNPQQQMIMKIMPIFLPVISFGLPAGLVLYFAVSNLYRIAQQAFISHSIYGGKANGMTWKDMLGLGSRPQDGKPKPKATSKTKATTKTSKAIPASSRPSPKGKAPAKAGTGKGSRPAPSKSSSRSSKGEQGGETPAKTSSRGGSSGRSQPAAPKPSGGADDGTPSLQPRARKKKR